MRFDLFAASVLGHEASLSFSPLGHFRVMPQFLYVVTEVFDIAGRFVIAVPGIPPETQGIRKHTALELRRPDGSILPTRVQDVAMVSPYDPRRPIQFSFPPGLTKADIPVGTEVWLAEGTPQA